MGAISEPESNEVTFVVHAMLDEVCGTHDSPSDDDAEGAKSDLRKTLNTIVSSALDPHISTSAHSSLGSRNLHARDKLAKLEYQATNGRLVSSDGK